MADPALVQFKKGSNTPLGVQSTTFDGSVVVGSVVCVNIYKGSSAATVLSCVDGLGNTYAQIANTKNLPIDGDGLEQWWAYVATGGVCAVTVTVSTGGSRVDLAEVGPCDSSQPDAANSGYNAGSTTPDSGNVTTSSTRKTCGVGFLGTDTGTNGTNLSPGAGWTVRLDDRFRAMVTQDAIAVSTTLSANGTVSPSMEWAMLVATFKGVAATDAQEWLSRSRIDRKQAGQVSY